MNQKTTIDIIEQQKWLGTAGNAIQPAILKAFEAGGETGNDIKNFLHGTWLGHPLHPAITDVPIGAWTTAAVLDGMELLGEEKYAPGADAAIAVGLVGAVGAAVTGLTDWTGTTRERRKLGLIHGLLNVGATALYATSFFLRRLEKSRGTAIGLSMLGYGVASASAYLGGHLVFGKQIGVDHTATAAVYPKDFVAVLAENKLAENTMQRVEAGEVAVLLARKNGEIFAIAHTCSHLGGPLSEGELLDDGSVRCPWHGSVFSLKDGSVIDGPATEPEPKFDVRVNNGQIEVKLQQTGSK
ncbi:Rieske 2Fe-2S domain-containing protein [Pontibacter sp. 172403-2]|uniref:Rieske 2Fe-2S domain-containing protein n=1 Tax=Pontibacter rufus TaxID=2791028 RepID=UPI0018AFEAB4|nr:Rieske 2Fe-2S domain-containing protein [Pontibacter sp. 172403-2]MBF9253766.1 Rieske 2Fe-2S domain-containing protein [Pontibacter sp. 172403-2]